jgi:phosphate:Na+ symporter
MEVFIKQILNSQMFDGWKFFAGLGIFLFGMFMMEESIKLLAGRSFKTLIRRYTGNRFKGVLTGLVSTVVLQSSSAVSLMVLAFSGAGLMSLVNAMAVIMGAMVGTTFTAWLVALLGFKFKIDAFALPLIGSGGLGLIVLGGSPRYVNISKLIAAFGFLFLGLDFMKTSVETLASSVDLALVPDWGLWIFALVGTVLTAVMQSSSATIAVILTTLSTGVLDFPRAAAMVIGANVGTTVTILFGAIGGIPVKKQAAASSILFNLGTALVVLPGMPVMMWIIGRVFNLSNQGVLGIAAFHTLFNVLGVILFFPAIPRLSRFLSRLFPEKQERLTRFIHNTSPDVPEAALEALRKEILNQLVLSMVSVSRKYRLEDHSTERTGHTGLSPGQAPGYDGLEGLHADIFSFYAKMQAHEIHEREAVQLEPVIRSSRSIMNATKNLFELFPEIQDIGREEHLFLETAHRDFLDRLSALQSLVNKVAAHPGPASLEDFFNRVEEEDKKFIGSCSKAVARGTLQANQVTRLLMINRLFTQSLRMITLSLRTLLQEPLDLQTLPESRRELG